MKILFTPRFCATRLKGSTTASALRIPRSGMESEMFNVAILGAGNIANYMAEAINGLSDVCLYAIGSRSMEKAEKFAQKWGAEKAYGSYEELADDDNIDLVYIATPHSEHYKNALLCMSKGRNLLVEKAFCGNVRQSLELVEFAHANKIYLCEAMWTHFLPSTQIIRNILDEHAIGNIKKLESDFSIHGETIERLINPALAGGALLDLGIYSITSAFLFLGKDYESVSSSCEKHKGGMDCIDNIEYTYKNGIKAYCRASFVGPMNNKCVITGDKGILEFGPINNPDYIELKDLNGQILRKYDIPQQINGYEYELLSSINSIRNNEFENEIMPLDETIRVMKCMDELRNTWGVKYPFD